MNPTCTSPNHTRCQLHTHTHAPPPPHQAEKRELESANEELRTALDAALGEARALSSRATVAEESREAASQTLLNLTQRAAVLEAEKQVRRAAAGG